MYMRDQNFMLSQLLIGIYYNENMDVARETGPPMQCWCSRRRRFVFVDSIYKNYKAKGRQNSAFEPHESYMQVLNTKHELKKDLLAC